MTVYFYNKEPIDLNAISIMGVSVKKGNNPIGWFGTGAKFSIATWLRHGCSVTLIRDGEVIKFDTKPADIRGENFNIVTMNSESMGFTTALGRAWEPWQAYRELACNATDEDGSVSSEFPEGDWGTIFVVSGGPADEAYSKRHETFISTPIAAQGSGCDIHRGVNRHGYYRGVRAHTMEGYSLFTYNVKDQLNLTEDRTIKEPYYFKAHAMKAVLSCEDEDIVHDVVMADQGSFERTLDFDTYQAPSEAFLRVVNRLRSNAHLNPSALKAWMRHAGVREVYTPVNIDDFEQQMLQKAYELLRRIGCDIGNEEFIVVDGLGEGVFGTVRSDQIIIARRTFDMGHRFLASTLYEEWLHANEGIEDESRDLQNLLFEKLFGMIERVVSMETRGPAKVAA